MFCTKCGKELSDDTKFCPACGSAIGAAAPAAALSQAAPAAVRPETKRYHYGGFWIRYLAFLIDQLVIGVVLFVFVMIGLFLNAGSIMALSNLTDLEDADPEIIMSVILPWILIGLIATVAQWLYYALMESSASRGTLGKMALGLQVIGRDGGTISFARATGRYFSKIVSKFILYIGFFMIGFTQKKQGLHDIMCDTFVVYQRDTLDYE